MAGATVVDLAAAATGVVALEWWQWWRCGLGGGWLGVK